MPLSRKWVVKHHLRGRLPTQQYQELYVLQWQARNYLTMACKQRT